jgi:hypothetical protein
MRNRKRSRLIFALLSVLLVVLIVIGGVVIVNAIKAGQQATISPQPTTAPTQNGSIGSTPMPTTQGPVSPLLFGTNLGLFTTNDQVVTSATTRSLMQQIHVRIVRIPLRRSLPNALEVQAEQAVKSIGAVPLVVLNGLRDPNALADDTRMIQNSNSVFGNSLVYYEFGNEDDYNGVPIDRYTQGWNMLVPQLKRLALHGKFVGPVSYQYDHNNLTTFLQGANPRPDAVSWHEYTCSYKDAAADCLAHLSRWTVHISDARAVMQATLGTMLPIMITEWNYAADQSTQSNGQPIPDAKYDNTSFITTWTSEALHILAANGVFASMQYSVTNTALSLIASDNTLTPQGVAFQSLYQAMVT